ncbi:MAG: hypothetical protein KDB94_11825 [Acidobacteria bacterium]|nr:hypothetical protein [Phycisphaerales bacterium]MCB1009567.1 hypothetical protein [Acidobacteriota bacterium]MCB9378174.1 hypothetical protein [Holophagales bacterium]
MRLVRMKNWTVAFAIAALALAVPAHADLCTIEATPAATLLLPYFEVDIDNADGVDTFISVNNASNESVLTHVIVWGDWSVEALDFNIYLTGYDVQTVGLGLIIRDGILPRTARSTSVSPIGPYSGSAPSYPGCSGILPYTNPALDAEFLAHLQSILTGGPSSYYGGLCGGENYGDNIARGYVTIDVVHDCTLLTPCDPGYFTSEGGVYYEGLGGYENVLWGDWYMIDYANNFAQGDTLVHIEAVQPGDQAGMAAISAGSFYNRCVIAEDGFTTPWADLRESLATTFATRFYQNAAFTGGTDFLVWKDSQYPHDRGYSCGGGPFWWPLPEAQVVFFDEQENPETVCTISPCPQEDVLFPNETNRVSVTDIDVTPESGWVYMNLNQNFGAPYSYLAQAWVSAIHSAEGRFSAGLSAIQLDSFCDVRSIILGPYGDDYPYSQPLVNYFNSNYYYGDGGMAPRQQPRSGQAKSWN